MEKKCKQKDDSGYLMSATWLATVLRPLTASPNYSYGGLNMLNQIQLKRYAELSGYTEKALRDKISTGVWVEGLHYYRAPDRHILINVKEVEKWQRNEYQPV